MKILVCPTCGAVDDAEISEDSSCPVCGEEMVEEDADDLPDAT